MKPPTGSFGPTAYFRDDDSQAVFEQLQDRYPPEAALWGTNSSEWKEGYTYVHGEDEIPMEEIVKAAVRDPSTVLAVPFMESIERERRSRDG